MKKVLMPIPCYGFDPTEVAIPWKLLSGSEVEVVFATPDGEQGTADEIMLNGKGLGIWKSLLKARKDAVVACEELYKDVAFQSPISYRAIKVIDFDGLILPGGHDKKVKDYLESHILQQKVAEFFKLEKPIAAICHGVIVAARSIDPETHKSVLFNFKTTCLLKSQELAAYKLTKLWLKDYYLTYPEITTEDEVKSKLACEENFISGPKAILRDHPDHLSRGFVVKDRHYISARWPGDIYNFSLEFLKLIKSSSAEFRTDQV